MVDLTWSSVVSLSERYLLSQWRRRECMCEQFSHWSVEGGKRLLGRGGVELVSQGCRRRRVSDARQGTEAHAMGTQRRAMIKPIDSPRVNSIQSDSTARTPCRVPFSNILDRVLVRAIGELRPMRLRGRQITVHVDISQEDEACAARWAWT